MRPVRTRLLVLAGVAATLLCAIGASSATAAGAAVAAVRIEGKSQTLFEGPVRSSGSPVRASSDTQQRRCDGTNNDQSPTPGATATGASVGGLRTEGVDFDATWFPGFDDYYVTRFGPDHEDLGAQEYWGILQNDAFTEVGGCQAQVGDGDRVLWAYDAFHQRGFLKLAVAGDAGATPQPTTTVPVGQPLAVRVTRYDGEEGETPAPIGGVTVGEVTTAANGFQQVSTSVPPAVTTAPGSGTADITFSTPGWHRIKADGGTTGPIRSNRLDVCVTAGLGGGCGDPPADTLIRTAAPLPPDRAPPGSDGDDPTPITPITPTTPTAPTPPSPPTPPANAPVIELPRFTAAGTAKGLVGVSWRVRQPGIGVKSWAFGSRRAGERSGGFTTRARGTTGTSALLRLPAGQTSTVQATFTDALGRAMSQTIGDTLVPLDDDAKAVTRHGWTSRKDAGAWLGRSSRGRAGATLSATLAAGRPVVLVRGVRRTSDVEIRVGAARAVYRVKGSATHRTREIVAARRTKAGQVSVRVVSGEVRVDGVGVRP